MKLTKEQEKQLEKYLVSLPENQREYEKKRIEEQLENQAVQCPFCLMSEGKIPVTKVYEDEFFLGVLEINPANKGHTLLFSKRHVRYSSQLSDDEASNLGKIIKKFITSLLKFSGSVNVLDSEGELSGQRFEHFVINFIPRTEGDSVKIEWQPKKSDEKELEKVREEIVMNFPAKQKIEEKVEKIDEEKLKEAFDKLNRRMP